MIPSRRDTVAVARPDGRRLLWQVLMAASLVPLGAGVVYPRLRSCFASAAPRLALRSGAAPMSKQSVPPHDANADADIGPGEVEPVLAGAQ
jgi:hypothetical protein